MVMGSVLAAEISRADDEDAHHDEFLDEVFVAGGAVVDWMELAR